MSLLKQQAAAQSAARQKKKKTPEPEPMVPAVPSPEGVIKTSPRGNRYRLYVISIADYPRFMESKGFEVARLLSKEKPYFHYKPEENPQRPNETKEEAEARYRSGFVLGVRRRGESEDREL